MQHEIQQICLALRFFGYQVMSDDVIVTSSSWDIKNRNIDSSGCQWSQIDRKYLLSAVIIILYWCNSGRVMKLPYKCNFENRAWISKYYQSEITTWNALVRQFCCLWHQNSDLGRFEVVRRTIIKMKKCYFSRKYEKSRVLNFMTSLWRHRT